MSIDDLLKNCPQNIQKYFVKEKYKKGEKIIFQGINDGYVFFLLSGQLKVFRILPDGSEYIIEYMDDFAIIGEIEALLQKTALAMVEAYTNCEVIRLERSKFFQWLKEDWDFAHYMLVSLASRISYLGINSAMRFNTTVDERLQILLQRASRDGVKVLYKSNISNELFTTQRSINRTLKKFSDQGIIEVSDNKITLVNTDKLL